MSRNTLTQLRVAVLWHDTVVAETNVNARTPVTIGEGVKNTLMIPAVGGVAGTHELFSPSGGEGFTLNLTPEMGGTIHIGGKEQTVEQARAAHGTSLSVSGSDWGVLDLGALAIFFQFVGQPAAIPRRLIWQTMETSLLASVLSAVVLHLGFLIAAFLFWDQSPSLVALDLSDRFLKVIVEPPPPEIEEEEKEENVDEDVGKKAGGEEGKFGEEDKKEKSKVPKRDGEMVDKVKDVGVHKALGDQRLAAGALKNVFGDKTGFDDKLNAAMSGAGDELIVGQGAGGMGLRGTGSGGGGEGFGRIHGMGKMDTGGGRGTRAKLGGKKQAKAKAKVSRGKASVGNFCKQADILRVVGARQGGIQACYERELARNPSLEGKVTASWVIGLDGKVVKAMIESSSLSNKSVEDCMVRSIKIWSFPKPEGGLCQVRFPFVFAAGL